MKTQGAFKYTVNGENKTEDEIKGMDLSNMDCTVDGLIISYFFPRTKSLNGMPEKRSTNNFYDLSVDALKTKAEEILDEVDKYQQKENGGVLKGGEFPYDFIEDFITSQKEVSKDDVITNSSRGEKEMMLDLVGIKETEGKLDYSEINFKLLDLMAKRFMDNKVKYPKGNSKKVLDKNEILWAAFRHIRKMIQPIENDSETYEEHLAAVATNMSIILDQLNLEK